MDKLVYGVGVNDLGYKYILWNGQVYLADGTPTVCTREDIR